MIVILILINNSYKNEINGFAYIVSANEDGLRRKKKKKILKSIIEK